NSIRRCADSTKARRIPAPLSCCWHSRSNLEPPLQAGRHANQRRAGEAVWSCASSAGSRCAAVIGIVAVSGNAPAARAEIKVRARTVERRRDVGVPGQVLAELMLIGCRDHIRLILIGSKSDARLTRHRLRAIIVLAGIARSAEGMRPAEMHAVH